MGYWRISGGKKWENDHFVPNNEIVYELSREKDQNILLNDNDLLVPGLWDMHLHLWSPAAKSMFGMPEVMHYHHGIIGGVDAGTYGYENWELANQYWQNVSPIMVKSFVSVQPFGLAVFPPKKSCPFNEINIEKLTSLILRHKEDALGLKIQLGFWKPKNPKTDCRYMEIGRQVCDTAKTNMMVHISGQCMDPSLQAEYMQDNDIITHIYSGFPNTILDEHGNVRRAIWAAKERGVKFDIGHAGKHFSWEVFQRAYAEGLKFDYMGGDLGYGNYRDENFPIYDQFHTISGFLNAGVPLDEMFRTVISNPQEYLGAEIDLSRCCLILKRIDGETAAGDGMKKFIPCKYEYIPLYFINQGKLFYNHELKKS